MEDQQASFDPVPADFLKDIFLAPHSFSDPQHPEHGRYVHMELRGDLYSDAFNKISFLEFGKNLSKNAFMKVEKIVECQKSDSLLQKLKTKVYVNKEDELIRCEDWTINNSDILNSVYRVKLIQSPTDRFYGLVFPPEFSSYYGLYKQHLS